MQLRNVNALLDKTNDEIIKVNHLMRCTTCINMTALLLDDHHINFKMKTKLKNDVRFKLLSQILVHVFYLAK